MSDKESISAPRGGNAQGVTCALVSAVAFGLLVPYAKTCLEAISPLWFAALLLLGAGIGTGCVFAVRAALGKNPAQANADVPDAAKLAFSALLNAVAVALLAIGLCRTAAANASLLMGFEVAAATAFAWIFLGRHKCYKAYAAVGLIFLSSTLLCIDTTSGITFVPESLLVLLACAIRGYESTIKKSYARLDPLQVACARNLGGGIVLFALAFAFSGMPETHPTYVVGTLALGFATFGVGAVLHLIAQRDIGPARAEGYFALAPFVGMIVSWARFGFGLEPLFFGSLALMALGVWLAMDDSVFHEDAFAAITQERMALYTGEASAIAFDLMHRPLQR